MSINYDPGRVNREQWLTDAITMLRPDFKAIGLQIPAEVRVSCGWSSKGAKGKAGLSRIGECWSPASSSAGYHEIFISPIIDDALLVAATLVHELVHACIGVEQKHGKVFGKFARKIGLKAPMKATTAGPKLTERLTELVRINGEYPHARMEALTNGKKKQATRMLKVSCPTCGYTVRIAAKWLEEGFPTCPCGTEMKADEVEK